jgi:hypothetical protein
MLRQRITVAGLALFAPAATETALLADCKPSAAAPAAFLIGAFADTDFHSIAHSAFSGGDKWLTVHSSRMSATTSTKPQNTTTRALTSTPTFNPSAALWYSASDVTSLRRQL